MRFSRCHSAQPYGIITVTLVFIICVNLAATDEINAENESLDKDLRWERTNAAHYHDENHHSSSEILSRKRRYLTFPSGSSFQLVYDLIIGVVDFTNYLILGVTSALAWQLPSDAPSAIIDNLRDRLKDGTLGTSRNDTIENIQYVDTKPKQAQKHPQTPAYITSFTNPSFVKPQTSTYYTNNQFHPPMNKKYYSSNPVYYSNPSNTPSRKYDSDYYSYRENPLTEWKDSKTRKVSPTSLASSGSNPASKWSQWWNDKKRTYRKPYVRKHRIYPVFAKRSLDEHNRPKRHGIEGPNLSEIDQIHLRIHRSSRQDLYTKIEKYLETHNKNGHQCVLKALCETGQKSNEVEPGTFVGEIMRSIFTMPESEDPVQNYRHKLYDDAHAHDGNCTDKFPLCPESVWKADFIL